MIFESTPSSPAGGLEYNVEDAIQYAPDKTAAVREAASILRPGGRFVFTAFELEES